ncbi:MAG: polysaccharide biosynthesis C-terminal domain-containing protein [Cytophagales bacterium]|nr:polysaccharide biosynthesis C-terminal domain-containing protein [Cytophagales bacterium]
MSFLKKLAGDSVLYGINTIVGRLLNWLLVPLHTRVFVNPEVLAENNLLYTYVIPLNILFTFGMETTFFRYGNKPETQKAVFNQILSFILVLSVSLAGLIIVFATPIVNYFGFPGKERLIIWIAIIMAIDAISAIAFAKLRINNQVKKFVGVRMLALFINIGLNLFFFLVCLPIINQGSGAPFYSLLSKIYNPSIGPDYIILANYVASSFTLLFLWKEFVPYRFQWNKEELQKYIKYAYPLIFLGLAGSINLTADRLMLRSLLPEGFYVGLSTDDAFSIYANAYKISIFMTLIVQAYRFAADPFFFSNMGDKNSPSMLAISTKWFTIACIVLWVGVSLNIDWIGMLLGENYRSGLIIVPWLLLANLFIGLYGNMSVWYKLTDRTIYGTYITVIGMVITVALNFILIPKLGYMGCAYAFTISSFVMVALSYYYGQKYYPVPYETKRILLYLLAAAGFIVLNSYLNFDNMIVGVSVRMAQCFLFIGLIYYFEKNSFSQFKAHS